MEKNEIIQRLKTMLVEDLFVADQVDDIDIDGELDNDLGLDSVGFVELATLVGETFDIKISDADIGEGHFTTVSRLATFIHQAMAADKVEA